jgi:hypothetical protein
VLTYMRNTWGSTARAVPASEVSKSRADLWPRGRRSPGPELCEPVPTKFVGNTRNADIAGFIGLSSCRKLGHPVQTACMHLFALWCKIG